MVELSIEFGPWDSCGEGASEVVSEALFQQIGTVAWKGWKPYLKELMYNCQSYAHGRGLKMQKKTILFHGDNLASLLIFKLIFKIDFSPSPPISNDYAVVGGAKVTWEKPLQSYRFIGVFVFSIS